MKIAFLNILLILSSCFTGIAQKKNITIGDNKYQLTFNDEFTGKKIDTTKWIFRTDSKHWSTQLKENVVLKSGCLYLNLKKEKSLEKEYTGAGIISIKTFEYGYYEASLKIPPGEGWHTSFWLMKYDGNGGTNPKETALEIDILENDSKYADAYELAFHKWEGEHESVGYHVTTPNMQEDFILLACEYTCDYVKYFMNGDEVRTINISDYPKGNLNIWITSIASHLGGTESVDETKLPAAAIIDYVRYYQVAN